MNQKQIGLVVLIIGVVLAVLVFSIKIKDDILIDKTIHTLGGSCYLDDGTCLHQDRNYAPYIIGWLISGSLIILGLYLIYFDKTQKVLSENQEKIASALKENKKSEKFEAFLSGFNEDEQKVLKAIKEQEGILQSTLRYRVDMSKAALSVLLKDLEKRKIVSRQVSGKTYKVFLKKGF